MDAASGSTGFDEWRIGDVVDGQYDVIGVLGRGAMGVVHRVHHRGWGMDLAVKSPLPALLTNDLDRELFSDEAQTWVALGFHPHVCTCHYVRTLSGIPRVFAEYLASGSLARSITGGRLYAGAPREAVARVLDIAIQIAWGLDHAHRRGVIHQDVKPANVLLDDHGTAKISDFGLAQARSVAAGFDADRPPGLSILVHGAGGMTPEYASPEQFAWRPLGRRSDIFSFAVSVLEMCLGRRTWRHGPDAGQVSLASAAGPLAVPSGLAGLLTRCLSVEPALRPESMDEVSAELIEIYRQATGLLYPRELPSSADLRADELNNRALSLLDLDQPAEAEAAFSAALAVDARHRPATYNLGLTRWRQGAIADDEVVRDVEAVRSDSTDPWEGRYLLAQVHMERGDVSPALDLLADANELDADRPDVRVALAACRSGAVVDGPSTDSRPLPWRSEGHELQPSTIVRIDSSGRIALMGCFDGRIRAWDLETRECVRTLPVDDVQINSVDMTADGSVAVSGADGRVRLWDLAGDRHLRDLPVEPHGEPWGRFPVRISADGTRVLSPDARQRAHAWDVATGEHIAALGPGSGTWPEAGLSADGRIAVTTAEWDDGRACVWDTDSGALIRVLPSPGAGTMALGVSADGRIAIVATKDLRIRAWELDSGTCIRVLDGDRGGVDAVAVSLDNQILVCAASNGAFRFWDLAGGRCLRSLTGHRETAADCVSMSLGGRSGIHNGRQHSVRWSGLPDRGYIAPLHVARPTPHGELSRLNRSAEEQVIAAEEAMADTRYPAALVHLTQARSIPGHEMTPRVLAANRALGRYARRSGLRAAWLMTAMPIDVRSSVLLSRDGRIAAIADDKAGRLGVWELADDVRCLRTFDVRGQMGRMRLTDDGKRILMAGAEEHDDDEDEDEEEERTPRRFRVQALSVETGECLLERELDTGSWTIAFSADGRRALFAGAAKKLTWMDLASGQCLWRRDVEQSPHSLCISSDERFAVTSAPKSPVLLWDLATGVPLRELEGEAESLTTFSMSEDGSRILCTGDTVRLWDTASGRILRRFDGSSGRATATCFTADGRFAVTGGSDHLVHIRDLATGRLLHSLSGHSAMIMQVLMPGDGRFILSRSDDGIRLWGLDWEWTAQDPVDWHDGASPFLNAFLSRHRSGWNDHDLEDLLERLQHAGYGWIRPEGVRSRLESLRQ